MFQLFTQQEDCLFHRFDVRGRDKFAARTTLGGGFPAGLFRLLGGFTVPPSSRCQLPPRQTQRADFPHGAFLSASCRGL